MLDFWFLTRKGTFVRGTASFDVFCVKISSGDSAVGRGKNPKNRVNVFDAQFRAYGENLLKDRD